MTFNDISKIIRKILFPTKRIIIDVKSFGFEELFAFVCPFALDHSALLEGPITPVDDVIAGVDVKIVTSVVLEQFDFPRIGVSVQHVD